jgi:hypothetical protein
MSRWKRLAPVVVALAISVVITVLFGTGMLSGGGNETPIDIERDENRTPAPIANGTQSGAGTESLPAREGMLGFRNVAESVGFDYDSVYRGRGQVSQSGVYVVDYDNDGDEDLLATGGQTPVLFRNTGGGFERARAFDHPDTRAAHFFDYDNDGWRDLVLAEYAGKLRFYENRNGSFERTDIGLERSVRSPTSITSADFTGNGCLDLFVGQNGLWQQGLPLLVAEVRRVQNNPDARPTTTPGGKNLLYYGDCTRFQEATDRAGIHGRNWTLATSAADFTGDGYVDIHVGNDLSADFLYVNQGNGTFKRHDLGPRTDRNAMASVAKDMTGDGRVDLFITNVYATDETRGVGNTDSVIVPNPHGNNFLVNTNGTDGDLFVDRAEKHGLDAGGWGWAAAVDDFNNDGHLDVVHGTSGDIQFQPYDRFRTPQVWTGTADSWQAVDERALGLAEHQARGMARLDFDSDGALDFALATTSASQQGGGPSTPFALYENELSGTESLQLFVRNPGGVARGAVVLVETDVRTVQRRVGARAGFLSQDSRLIHVGTATEKIEQVRVLWPDGTESTYDDLQEGNRYVLTPDGSSVVK